MPGVGTATAKHVFLAFIYIYFFFLFCEFWSKVKFIAQLDKQAEQSALQFQFAIGKSLYDCVCLRRATMVHRRHAPEE